MEVVPPRGDLDDAFVRTCMPGYNLAGAGRFLVPLPLFVPDRNRVPTGGVGGWHPH